VRAAVPVSPERIPVDITETPNWVVWRYVIRDNKWTKPPFDAKTGGNAKSTDPSTWTTFGQALQMYTDNVGFDGQTYYAGIGFVLTKDGGHCAVDLDHCITDGVVEPWAQKIADDLRSYTETSPSGEGLRILVRGVLPDGRRKKGSIEAYSESRYVTITGSVLPGSTNRVEDRAAELAAFHAQYLVGRTAEEAPDSKTNNRSVVVVAPATMDLAPSGLTDGRLLERAMAAKNGAAFMRLWEGDWSAYPSHSEADLTLCADLAFWSGDMEQTDRLFRASGLFREKWDASHYADGSTYGMGTIATAFTGKTDFFSPQTLMPTRARALGKREVDTEGRDPRGAPDGKLSAADLIIRLAQDSGAEFFRDQRNSLYVAFDNALGRREVSGLATPSFGRWLTLLYYNQVGRAARPEAVKGARAHLEALAQYEGAVHPLSLQIARAEDDSIYVDLGDWRAVRVTADGWSAEDRPPVLFRRYSHMAIHPEPRRGGRLDEIFAFLNLKSDVERTLFLAYLVAALVPGLPTPVLIATGEKGTAKTTSFRLVSRLVAPSIMETLGKVDRIEEFNRQAAHARALFFDNLTVLQDWLSDALCRVVTGDAWSKRELYTDDDDVIHAYRRLAGINSIAGVADKADLLDRAIIIRPPFIPEDQRREESEFWADFELRRPYIFGALLDTLSAAMREYPGVQLTCLPRMADFARWGCATMRALGRPDEDFLNAYQENVSSQNEEALEASPVAQAILLLVQGQDYWEGTAAQLHSCLSALAMQYRIPTDVPSWPRDARKLGARVTEVAGTLRSRGVTAAKAGRTNAGAKWVVTRVDRGRVSSLSGPVSSLTSTVSSLQSGLFSSQNHASDAESDDSDDRMGASLVFDPKRKEEGIGGPTPPTIVVVEGGTEPPKLSARSSPLPATGPPNTTSVAETVDDDESTELIAWLHAASLPTEPFDLSPGAKVAIPDKFYLGLRDALTQGPGGSRWRRDALRDAGRLKQIVDASDQSGEVAA
jgi:hypothetical protein